MIIRRSSIIHRCDTTRNTSIYSFCGGNEKIITIESRRRVERADQGRREETNVFNLKVGAKKTKGGRRCNWIILSGKVESASFVVRSPWFPSWVLAVNKYRETIYPCRFSFIYIQR